MRACLRRDAPGPYQLQAAINAVHTDAAAAADTDWSQVVALYDHLLRLAPTDVVRLNRAVAVAELDGPQAGARPARRPRPRRLRRLPRRAGRAARPARTVAGVRGRVGAGCRPQRQRAAVAPPAARVPRRAAETLTATDRVTGGNLRVMTTPAVHDAPPTSPPRGAGPAAPSTSTVPSTGSTSAAPTAPEAGRGRRRSSSSTGSAARTSTGSASRPRSPSAAGSSRSTCRASV